MRKKKEKKQPVGRNSFAAVSKVKQGKIHNNNDVYECFSVDKDQNKEREAAEEEVTDTFDGDKRKISCLRKFFCCCCKGKTE